MFESVLIANRGEIACRIVRTCRRLGIRTIAVYSDADAGARHVREADHAVRIGPADATRSYLDADAIVAAAQASGASAVHPGLWLPLREARVWSSAATRTASPGSARVPRSSRRWARRSNRSASRSVPACSCVPGYHGEDQSPKRLLAEARAIGSPLLIKASAGGGGKGMRRVDDLGDFSNALELAQAARRCARSATSGC